MKKLLSILALLSLTFCAAAQSRVKMDTTIYQSYSVYQPVIDTVPYTPPTLEKKRENFSVNQRPQRTEGGRVLERVLTDVFLITLTGALIRR